MAVTPWRWYDTPIVLAGGAVAGLVAGLVAGAPSVGGVYDPGVIFWLIIPLQNLGHLGALLLIGRRRGHLDLPGALGFEMLPSQVRWVFAGAAASIPLSFLAAGLRSLLGLDSEASQAIVDAAAAVSGTVTMIAVVLGVGVLGPVVEELIHRGLVYQTVLQGNRSPAAAVVISAAVFSAVHLADPSLYSLSGAVILAVLLVFGLFLGVLRLRTGSLGASIFAHSGFNLMTVAVLFFLA